MSDPRAPDDDDLDGCELDFAEPSQLTEDGEQTDALVMFADCWDQPDEVERRRVELTEWDAATRGDG